MFAQKPKSRICIILLKIDYILAHAKCPPSLNTECQTQVMNIPIPEITREKSANMHPLEHICTEFYQYPLHEKKIIRIHIFYPKQCRIFLVLSLQSLFDPCQTVTREQTRNCNTESCTFKYEPLNSSPWQTSCSSKSQQP